MLKRVSFILLCSLTVHAQDSTKKPSDKETAQQRARAVIERSIAAMGGDRFRQVREIQSKGHFFLFKDGQTAGLAKYIDYTRLPDKSRNQTGEGKNKEIAIFDLSANKGWHQEGKSIIKEATPDEVRQFRQTVRHAWENLLRGRLDEPGMTFFYYGSEDITGKGEVEAVEMIDAENDSVLFYCDLKTHLPTRMEYTSVDRRGEKHKEATEFYNWHLVQGVMTPHRQDNFSDGQSSSQLFIDEITYNPKPALSDALFSKPVPEK
ncbi:MAG TPA: hypothetical protein VGQ81_15115 [Acidobacteriota bacterium]|jgi:hypothetical protein|nr:hypothetical protein [Acidobacteriota bacterium]